MLKKFVLKNYKNFKDEIEVDLQDVAGYQFSNDCISDDDDYLDNPGFSINDSGDDKED